MVYTTFPPRRGKALAQVSRRNLDNHLVLQKMRKGVQTERV